MRAGHRVFCRGQGLGWHLVSSVAPPLLDIPLWMQLCPGALPLSGNPSPLCPSADDTGGFPRCFSVSPFGFLALPRPAKPFLHPSPPGFDTSVVSPPCVGSAGCTYQPVVQLSPNVQGSGAPDCPVRAVCLLSEAGPPEGSL